jgi:hypothetical protein
VPRKNVEYIPVTRNPRTALEPIRPRRRRMRSGMIGFSIRASIVRNAPINTIARAPKPSTWDEPQPWLVA